VHGNITILVSVIKRKEIYIYFFPGRYHSDFVYEESFLLCEIYVLLFCQIIRDSYWMTGQSRDVTPHFACR